MEQMEFEKSLPASEAVDDAPAKKKAQKKGKSRPEWAITNKMREEEKEKEIDNLIEFAYDLDYEKYLEDYEVRQALALIKDRVKEIKEDDDWKKNIADEWNHANQQEAAEGIDVMPADGEIAPE